MQYNNGLADRAAQRMKQRVKQARDGNPVGMRITIEMADYMIPIFVLVGPLVFDYIANPGKYGESEQLEALMKTAISVMTGPNQPVM